MTTQSKTAEKVKPKSDAAKDLNELFIDSMKDIYWAEKALTKAIPKMIKNSTSKELKKALEDHLGQTEEHVTRLEDAFEMIGKKAIAKKCKAMDGIIDEGDEIIKETEPGDVRDAGIIAAGQKVEHYEIATYGTIIAWAKELKLDEVAKLLHTTLKEEKAADEKLAKIASSGVNKAAEN